ncbi:MAG: hypothetical protein SCALA702_30420 [Melioribacteraceae bacterium]|nr:MAG: hypothetical protein SCALA702_30420 [Melioribacteraceae bacterium]
MTDNEFKEFYQKALDHLLNGRYKLGLNDAEKLIEERPNDGKASVIYGWALLENGDPAKALEFANLAVELAPDSFTTRMYRGIILGKMSNFDGAINDLDNSLNIMKGNLALTYHNKSRAFAGMFKFGEALKFIENAVALNINSKNEILKTRELIQLSLQYLKNEKLVSQKNFRHVIDEAHRAIKNRDYWFTLFVCKLSEKFKFEEKESNELKLLELEARFHLFQYRQTLELSQKWENSLGKNLKFKNISAAVKEYLGELEKPDKPAVEEKSTIPATSLKAEAFFFENQYADVFSAKIYKADDKKKDHDRKYFSHINTKDAKYLGIEIIFNNPFFETEEKKLSCNALWYINDKEIGRNNFSVNAHLGWDAIIFAQTWGSSSRNYWTEGQGRVDVFIENVRIARIWFVLGNEDIEIPDDDEPDDISTETKDDISEKQSDLNIHQPDETKTLEELVEELNSFIGLKSVKSAVADFINFLKFLSEREKLGLKRDKNLSINAAFLGNPGTGKTTIARLLGNIFKSMGILAKGHVIEVDRAALVGQYVGETAQKTEKIISEAMGGVLFIDEAYTLVKKGGSGQDFGQEAIDILLKRMEDKKGEFVVIVAGYPDEMETFLTSNPGMKSRFNHFFNFDDYSPDELMAIYKMMLDKDQYHLNENAEILLKKEFIKLYRSRDKTFGNARLVRKFVEDTKMELGKRFLELPDEEKTKENITTVIENDISNFLSFEAEQEVDIPIDEEALSEALEELNKLTGLRSVLNDIQDTIKLARYYLEQGENIRDKFSSHILFLGNPGTGKTTVARIVSQIYSALGILSKGHLVETDRQNLVSGYVGQTSEKTSKVIDSAIGGTLFIDEAYTLVKAGDPKDFGKEAIDTLLKRMEDDRGKFIVIAAGYTREMQQFLESNPGMQSRFTKRFMFEDYTPDELMVIFDKLTNSKKLVCHEKVKSPLLNYFNELYRNRDHNFGNARLVRNVVDSAVNRMMLRLADTPSEKRTAEMIKTIILSDFEQLKANDREGKKYEVKGDPKKLEKHLGDLDSLTGLESVKTDVKKLISGLQVARLRKQRGLKVIGKSLHAVFTGNPGTGKTTVARKMSLIYKELGLIEKGHLVEVDRADLVAGFQGQTAMKTDKVIQSALGGTLFIDEAYTLSRKGSEYGQEAIDALLKRMEDYKGKLIVIVAGYPKEMDEFLKSNPGLESRFTNLFHFDDYNPRQMLEITVKMADSNGYNFDEGALQLLLEHYNEIYSKRDKTYGNARTARNVLYKTISHQEERIALMENHSNDDLTLIKFEDVENITI